MQLARRCGGRSKCADYILVRSLPWYPTKMPSVRTDVYRDRATVDIFPQLPQHGIFRMASSCLHIYWQMMEP